MVEFLDKSKINVNRQDLVIDMNEFGVDLGLDNFEIEIYEIVEEEKTQATEEQLKIKSAAEADIEQNVTKAKENLKQEVSALVLAGAAKILEKEVNAESNKQIIDDLIKEL